MKPIAALALVLVASPVAAGPPRLSLPVWNEASQFRPVPGYAADRITLKLRSGAARSAYPRLGRTAVAAIGVPALDRALSALGARIEPEFRGEVPPPAGSNAPDFTSYYVVHLPRGVELASALEHFTAVAEVAAASPVGLAPAVAVPNDSLWSRSWWLYQPSRIDVRAPEAWDITRGDSLSIVALIDTGLLPYHPDISGTTAGSRGQIWTNRAEQNGLAGVDDDQNGFVDDVAGWDFVALESDFGVTPVEDWRDEDPDPNDYVGHGTLVAGVLGAINDNQSGVSGMGWNLRIMPLRVGWSLVERQTGVIDMVYLARAIRYATRMGATVINLSTGTTALLELDDAVDAAIAAGIPVVVAAGNNGSPNALSDRAGLIHVAATDRNDAIPIWSNRGAHVDLAAPGQSLLSTVLLRSGSDSLSRRQPAYASDASGTSFSAPLVSGAIALMQAYRRQLGVAPLSAEETRLALMSGCDDITAANPDILPVYFGAGRLNVARTLRLQNQAMLARSLGGTLAGALVEFQASSGERRVACATTTGNLVLLEASQLVIRATQLLGGVPGGGVAAADIGLGRGVGFFVSLSGGRVGGYGGAGLPLPGWPVSGREAPMAEPALGDLDGDGIPEVVTVAPHPTNLSQSEIWVWDTFGVLRPGFPRIIARHAAGSACAVADLDGIPGAEVVVAEDAGWVHALGSSGAELPGWPVRCEGGAPTSPVITRMDGTPAVMIVNPVAVHAILADGTIVPQATLLDSLPAFEPALGDLNHDGGDDLVIASPRSAQVLFPSRQTPTLADFVASWSLYPITSAPILGHLQPGDEPELLLTTTDGVQVFGADRTPAPLLWGAPFVTLPTLLAPVTGSGARLIAGSPRTGALHAYDAPPGSWSAAPQPWPTRRGNFARTGSRFGAPLMAPAEDRPPQRIEDLSGRALNASQVRLKWTARPDVPSSGSAVEYDLRWSTVPLHPLVFEASPRIGGLPGPAAAGTPESVTVAVPSNTNRYYSVRSRDGAGNWSEISNSVLIHIPSPIPFPVVDLALSAARETSLVLRWTATGDDENLGRPGRYEIRASPQPLTTSNFGNAPYRLVHLPTVDPGAEESAVLGGLARDSHLFVALRAIDTNGNASALSNMIDARTATSAAPARVSDLQAVAVTETTVTVGWTASGADGSVGRPDHYQLRASLLPITEANFDAAVARLDHAATVDAGGSESATLDTPTRNATWWLAVRAVDGFGVAAPISNLIQAHTLPSRFPAAVSDLRATAATESSLTFQWTATGADERIGRPKRYELRASLRRFGPLDFESAPLRLSHLATVDAGGVESATLAGLPASASLWVALRAVDGDGYASGLSNLTEAKTVDGRLKSGPTRIALALSRNPATPPVAFLWAAPDAGGALASIAIHDLGGRLRRRIGLPRDVTGRIEWDGTDDQGRRLGAGVYFVSLTRGDAGVRRRLVLLPR